MLRDRSLKRRRLPIASPERPEINSSLSQYMKQIEKVKKSIESIAKEYQTSGTLFRRNSNSNSKKFNSTAKTAPTNPKFSNLLSPEENNSGHRDAFEAEDKEESRILNVVYEKYQKYATSETDQSLKHVPASEEHDFKAKEIALNSLASNLKNMIDDRSIDGKQTQNVISEDNDAVRMDQISDQRLTDSTANLRKYWPTMDDHDINKLTGIDSVTPKSQQINRNGFALDHQSPSIIESKQNADKLKEGRAESHKSTSPMKLTTPYKILSQLTSGIQDISTDKVSVHSKVISSQNILQVFKKATQENNQLEEAVIMEPTDEYESADAHIHELNSSRTGEAFTLRDQENKVQSFHGQQLVNRAPVPIPSTQARNFGDSKYPFGQTDDSKEKLSESEDPAAFELKKNSEEDKKKDFFALTFGNQPLTIEKDEENEDQAAVVESNKKKSLSPPRGEAKPIDRRPMDQATPAMSDVAGPIRPQNSVPEVEIPTLSKGHVDKRIVLDQRANGHISDTLVQPTTSQQHGQQHMVTTREEFIQTEYPLTETQDASTKIPMVPSNRTITNKSPQFVYQKHINDMPIKTDTSPIKQTENSIKDFRSYFFLAHQSKQLFEVSSSHSLFTRPSIPLAEGERKLSSITQTTPIDKEFPNKNSRASHQEKKAANISVNEVKFLNNSIKNLQAEIDSLNDKLTFAEMARDNYLCSHKKSCEEINTLRNQIELLRQNLAERKYTIGELVDLVVASNNPSLQAEMNRILNESAFK